MVEFVEETEEIESYPESPPFHYQHGESHLHPHRQYSTRLERKIRGRHLDTELSTRINISVTVFYRFISGVSMIKNKKISNQNASKENRERLEPLIVVSEPERVLGSEHGLSRLSLVMPRSRSSSVEFQPDSPSPPNSPTHSHIPNRLTHGDESMTVVLSAFYAKLLIVLGIALPITSTIQNELYTNLTSDIFTMYLYIVSMLFLAYTFYHLRMAKRHKDENFIRTRYGSFYLHMGVAGFGVGSIIYSCLQFGGYFDLSGDCQMAVIAIKPALRILFMVAQTVFIFSYTDMLDPMRGVVLDRFGLMHLIATNVCEWLNVIIQETRDDIIAVAYDRPPLLRYTNITTKLVRLEAPGNDSGGLNSYDDNAAMPVYYQNASARDMGWTCNVSDMITPLIRTVNPYLRPCGVEYSLLCSIIIAVIWNDICTVPGLKNGKLQTSMPSNIKERCCTRMKSTNHFSVDCGSAHKGLFMGVAVLAGTIVSLMLFNGLFQNEKHVELALLQVNIWETILFILMSVGSAACIHRMRALSLRKTVTSLPLEHALLLVTQCGVYLYYLFQIIGAGFLIQNFPETRRATRIISPLCAVIQSSCQTLLVLDAWSRRSGESSTRKPGRQLITFLLVGNFALWLLNRVKNARAEFHPLQMEFYGVWAWTLITHVSVPLLVCYRFQATVCFYEIWKNAYKIKRDMDDIELEDIQLKKHNV